MTPRKKKVRLVAMHVRPVFAAVAVPAKDWRRYYEQPLGEPLGYDIQPEIVYDDGEALEKVEHPPVRIDAANWQEYVSKTFPAELRKWQAQLDAEQPSRAQRRR